MRIRWNTESFIEYCKSIFKYDYDYSLIDYINNSTHINIKCNKHNIFKILPKNLLKGDICPICWKENETERLKKEFIENSIKIHGDNFDYSLVKYVNNHTKVELICSKGNHVIKQTPISNLHGNGCIMCSNKLQKTTEEFISESKKVHNDYYIYDSTIYTTNKEKVIVGCPKHGDFSIRPVNHLIGNGCKYCHESLGEKEIVRYLNNNNIIFERSKTFENCKNHKKLPFDFYLPKLNMCIEYDGKQHFQPIKHWGDEKGLELRKNRDKIKDNFCKDNNIKLLRIKYNEKIIEKLNLILNI